VGSPGTVHAGLAGFIAATGIDELIVHSAIPDHAARVVSLTTRAAWDHARS
jgi:alkanesulfonate monooxygenase SsuD/methylene tetrahydromethanopterin reductase-like flavin-dependent oxidoreductase (luciferase family)